jgi:putative ABC transport system permease protein
MWRATVKGLLAKKLRLVLTALSVVLGIGFVAGTYELTDTMNAAFEQLFETTSAASDVTVRSTSAFSPDAAGPGGGGDERKPVPASLLDTIEQVPSVDLASGEVQGYAQIVDPATGDAIGGVGPPTLGVNWSALSEGVLILRQGAAPTTPNEVAIDAATAGKFGISIGDRVEVLFVGEPQTFTVSGIAGFGEADNLAGATLAIFDTSTAQRVLDKEGEFDAIAVRAKPGVGPIALRNQLQPLLPSGVEAVTSADVGKEQAQQFQQALGFFQTALLIFAGVALFVGSFIIFNTFSIIVAQRTRELALLRALGASRRQVLVSVIVEALLVGLIASAIGVLAGIAIAVGLQGLLSIFGVDLPSTGLKVQPRTIAVSMIVGTLITVLAAILPARKAGTVTPIEALREADPAETHERGRRRRMVIATVITILGVVSLLLGLFGSPADAYLYVGIGAAVTFIGVAMLSQYAAGPVAAIVGAPLARLGTPGGLGRRNAMRNPRRTARTASALMIGLGLVAMVAILGSSLKASFDAALQQALKADFTIATTSFTPFSPDVATKISAVPEVDIVSQFRQGGFRVNGSTAFVSGIDPATIEDVTSLGVLEGNASDMGSDGILVSGSVAESNGWAVGDSVPAAFGAVGKHPLTISGVYDETGVVGDYAISLTAYEELFANNLDVFVLVKTVPGTDPAQAQSAIESAVSPFPNIDVLDQASFREKQEGFIDQLLGLITALLLMAIVIAVFGIVNTLGLSVHERTRELGLLRAVGLSRTQTKRMVRVESVIIAVFGAGLGILVGVFFGWALQHSLIDQGVTELRIPVVTLLVYLVVSALVGVVAAIFPARRAAKLDVLQAIAYE